MVDVLEQNVHTVQLQHRLAGLDLSQKGCSLHPGRYKLTWDILNDSATSLNEDLSAQACARSAQSVQSLWVRLLTLLPPLCSFSKQLCRNNTRFGMSIYDGKDSLPGMYPSDEPG